MGKFAGKHLWCGDGSRPATLAAEDLNWLIVLVLVVWLGLTHNASAISAMVTVLDAVCEFCDSFKFEAIGFHETEPLWESLYEDEYLKSEFEQFLWKRKFKGESESLDQSEFERLKEILDRGETFADFYAAEYQKFKSHHFLFSSLRKRRLGEILDGAKSAACGFCRKVEESFRDWRSQACQELKDPDIQNALAYFSFETVICKPWGTLLRFWVIIEVPKPCGGHGACLLQFHGCNQQSLKVEDFCSGRSLPDWEESAPEQAFSGRIRPLIANTQLFRKWTEACAEKHHDICMSFFTGERPPFLRLIDVEKRCVVDCFLHEERRYFTGHEVGISYVALSYVWGKYKLVPRDKIMPELDKTTEDRFRQPWSLTSETILSTIDDAMEVAQSLGEKYLWVDCLCIRQDDEADKGKFILRMDSIYGFASVTIVAASGVDADAGLSGVEGHSPTRCEQMPFQVKGVSLLQTLDQEWQEYRDHHYQYLGDSLWCKRGWTLQEKIFSPRALIFSPKQVYWECQQATWCEDAVWETQNFPTAYRPCFGVLEGFRHPWPSANAFLIHSNPYRDLVKEYSQRALTNNGDGLDAFAGILNALERETGQRFIWALPTSFLREALLWEYDGSSTRRTESCPVRFSDGQVTKYCDFPSWSWLGWVAGKVEYMSVYVPKSNVIFYYFDDEGTLIQAPGETGNDVSRTEITHDDIPETVLALNIASNILFFWTDTAKLHVGYEVDELGRSIPCSSHHGENLCTLRWYHKPARDFSHDDQLAEFVVIGDDDFNLDDFIILLSIEWKDSGVAYRCGLAEIERSAWNQLDNRVWKMISLG